MQFKLVMAWASAAALLAGNFANAASPAVCRKALSGDWKTVADITPAGEVVGITDQLEQRELHAKASFSSKVAKYDGNTCRIKKVKRAMLTDEQRKLFHDPIRDKYPLAISFECLTDEGVGEFYIGQSCEEIVTQWDGASFLLRKMSKEKAAAR